MRRRFRSGAGKLIQFHRETFALINKSLALTLRINNRNWLSHASMQPAAAGVRVIIVSLRVV
jgi:hypothetical protein